MFGNFCSCFKAVFLFFSPKNKTKNILIQFLVQNLKKSKKKEK